MLQAGTIETKRRATNKYYKQIWSSTRAAGTDQEGTWVPPIVWSFTCHLLSAGGGGLSVILNKNTKGGRAVILQKIREYWARRLIYQLEQPEQFRIFPKIMETHQSRNKAPTSNNLFSRQLKLPHGAWIWGNQFRANYVRRKSAVTPSAISGHNSQGIK